jgi:hypothetical protein
MINTHKITRLGDRLVGYATLFIAGFLTAIIVLGNASC